MAESAPPVAAGNLGARTSNRRRFFMTLLCGFLIGIVVDRIAQSKIWTSREAPRNAYVDRDTYLQIKPGMTSWDVCDLLGSGELLQEYRYTVDARGNFKEYSMTETSKRTISGLVKSHDGEASKTSNKTVTWRDGNDRHIVVRFKDDQVVSKHETGVYKKSD